MAIEVRCVTDEHDRQRIFAIRREVFIIEQHVPEDEEYDDDDRTADHVLACVDGEPAGTGRLVCHSDWAKVGRMAVRPSYRRSGVGRAVLERLMQIAAERGIRCLRLNAQTQAIPFYRASGFEVVSEEFEEAGIPHRRMERRLADQ